MHARRRLYPDIIASKAIHCGKEVMDCSASLAMTWRELCHTVTVIESVAGMSACGQSSFAIPHSIPLSSSSAFLINSSLTTTVGRGTRKNIADAQAIDSAKIAAVNGSVVVEWPPR
jgi:hypothetical protein